MKPNPQSYSEIVFYQTADGRTRIEVRLENETVWLTQKLLSELFQKDVRTINEHIQNIFEEGELQREATLRKIRIVQQEGARSVAREVDFYNLDVIISVGKSRTSSGLRPPSPQSGEGIFCGTLTQGRCLRTATRAPTLD